MVLAALDGSQDVLVQSGSWIASDPSVDVDAKWGGGKTFFSGEGSGAAALQRTRRHVDVQLRRHPIHHPRAG